ncbi:helix-turn-helix transcriptional regulator [Flavobacterium sp. LPB0248]|uniref:helix-turn-helix domain-containing protein n=1 Tax=Flavobacterium sp. LPB0248 TaxID=2614441 RepID=UPI0015A5301C|nr:AraC family transcriptional regulator [Flavobacterium sp. LPB0248]QLC66332.1 helix-turn-helix transcriptional regulator [Flavobacterium sp. LPB0248]
MRTIKHSFGTDLNWAESLAQKLGGKFENNFIIPKEDNKLPKTRYILNCEDGITAYYVETFNEENFCFITENTTDNFISLYYDLTEGEGALFNADNTYKVGHWNYNFGVIDSNLQTKYLVNAGTKTFLLAIFINKETIRSFAEENNIPFQDIFTSNDSSKSIPTRLYRISSESFNLINDLRKLKVGGDIFDLNLRGTVHILLCNFLKKISTNTMISQTIHEDDLSRIILSQIFLMENIENHFPSIKLMAKKANMSESKFLVLFRKITGLTPNSFFIENKLYRSKELIEEQRLSIAEISDKLKFSNHSYFSFLFKKHFGLSPSAFAKQL